MFSILTTLVEAPLTRGKHEVVGSVAFNEFGGSSQPIRQKSTGDKTAKTVRRMYTVEAWTMRGGNTSLLLVRLQPSVKGIKCLST